MKTKQTLKEKSHCCQCMPVQKRNWKKPENGTVPPEGGGGVLPYMSYIGMCRCEGYGFQRIYSRIGYRNQRVLV